ncbi:MAG: phage portal protein [Oscillospiraceae bacterium]|nr:phage portal protein [Oscillospiraceae bacterium]
MGLFDKLFGNRPKPRGDYQGAFRLLNGYTPHFTSFGGSVYESELVRAAIDKRATHMSKLQVDVLGAAKPALRVKLKHGPNAYQTWGQFLYRLSTILDVHNTAFITPVWDEYGEISGLYAPLPTRCELIQYGGAPYIRYEFAWGERAAVELEYCGIMTRFQYKDDLFGESNRALMPTMDLIHIQNQGIQEGVKSAATYRFMAQLSNFAKAEDLKKERQRFTEENFSRDAEGGGLLLFPNTYTNIKQVDVKPWVVDADQMKTIRDSVYSYFGVNDDILTNKAYGDAWAAFYEGAVEPFAIQLSDVLTKMLFTFREQSQGNRVMATTNRIQYMTNADKLNVSAQMADRGLMTRNEIREIWNLPPLPEPIGNQLPVRGEYYNVGENSAPAEGGNDQ